MIKNVDDSEDSFRSYFHKIVILQNFQQILCEMLICGRINFHADSFLKPQISENVQNDSLDFEGLLHEILSKKHLINQEISYIIIGGEMKLSTVFNYTKYFFSII